ncbi:hypothetical protein RHS01_10631 [Rhizoctonia solani]|uniref:Uncharacterized protein n=1 Tax=Rhizoctonia solani TaxID=456999 RepID=A0A8H7I1K8_9AGAM|nr:hypothetical protein RHS01_10631 [Rhizoctonia solani]
MSTKTTLTVFTTASSVCKTPERFNTWLDEVRADPNIRRTLPKPIGDMVDESLRLPLDTPGVEAKGVYGSRD